MSRRSHRTVHEMPFSVLMVLLIASTTPAPALNAGESDLWTTTSGPNFMTFESPFIVTVGYANAGPDTATSAYPNHYFVPPVGLDVFVENTVNGDGSMYDALAASTEGTDTLGNLPGLFFNDNYCEEVLFQVQADDGDPSVATPVEGLDSGVGATFTYETMIPMNEASSSTITISQPLSLAQSWHGNITSILDAASKNAFSRGTCEKLVGGEDEEVCSYIADNCFGARVSQLDEPLEAEFELVFDGTADPTLGCEGFVGFTPGNIALLRRGTCEFGTKSFNAEQAGAIAVFMVNDGRCGDFPTSDQCVLGMLAGDLGYLTTIPTIQVSQADGESVITAIEDGATVRGIYGDPAFFTAQTTIFLADAADTDPDETNDDSYWKQPVDGFGCSYAIDPVARVFTSAGGTGTVTVATDDGCLWLASTTAPWISITSDPGAAGSGELVYQVDTNPGPGRTAAILIGSRIHYVSQGAGNGCFYALNPSHATFAGGGGTGDFDIVTQSDCEWSVATPYHWINPHPPSTGIGSATITYTVNPNASRPREGAVFVNDQIHTVSQLARSDCDQGIVADDGTPENGYGWGAGRVFVQRFTPDAYPFLATDVCTAFTQAGGDSILAYDVVIYDDDGPGGGPGTLLAAVQGFSGAVPPWLDHSFASVQIDNVGLTIAEGSVYVGVGWDDTSEQGFYVAADESTSTAASQGFFSADGFSWTAITEVFPNYRSLMIRFDGFVSADGEWEQVVGHTLGGGNGFGNSSNIEITSMASFEGGLYAGTRNTSGCEVHHTDNGVDWTLVNQPGWGSSSQDAVGKLISWGGYLFASTVNPSYGTSIWRLTSTGQWWHSESGGFGDRSNVAAPSGAAFDGDLFFGTEHDDGCEIWRTSSGSSWDQVHVNGFGDPDNLAAESMAVFNGNLYVGTRNLNGAELWRSPDGVVWFPMATGGFGLPSNTSITDLSVFGDMIYAGVSNEATGAQLWRSNDGSTWSQIVDDGFGNAANSNLHAFAVGETGLYAGVSGPMLPGTLWTSRDGTTWSQSSSPGFTNSENRAIQTLEPWGGRVFAGTSNPAAGCEVWRGASSLLFDDGFETGDTSQWDGTVP